MSEFILYNTEDGKSEIKIILDNETKSIWLSQKQMAELFDVSIKTINEHVVNIYEEGELKENPTIRNFRIVQREGERDVEREVTHYNLKLILAVGYRVRSTRGTQFRKWATATLEEYLVKGFVMNDERLKDTKGWDYFDELLERVRDIRASEKRFYQKVRDIFAQTSVDPVFHHTNLYRAGMCYYFTRYRHHFFSRRLNKTTCLLDRKRSISHQVVCDHTNDSPDITKIFNPENEVRGLAFLVKLIDSLFIRRLCVLLILFRGRKNIN